MFFPVLKKLKDSNKIDFDNLELFDTVLYNIYEKNYQERFNPNVYKYFDVELNENEWMIFLEKLCKYGLMQINFELCCPDCDRTIDIFHKYTNISLLYDEQCSNCFNYIETDLEDIFITYTFKPIFKPTHNFGELFRGKKRELDRFSLEDYIFRPQLVFERVINEKRENLKELLDLVITTEDKFEKGKRLEELSEEIFDVSPYFKVYARNKRYSTGEIDRIFQVKNVNGTIFDEFSNVMIIECKNWKKTVGTAEIKVFSDKMDDVQVNVGIFFSKNGISGYKGPISDARDAIRRLWDKESKIIIVITLDDLNDIILKEENFYEILEEKYYAVKTM